jgi:small-conductance mechanosensitive channel
MALRVRFHPLLLALLVLATPVLAPPARAQLPQISQLLGKPAAAPAAAPATPAPAAPAAPSVADARATLEVLKDDAKRAQLMGVLETIAKGQALTAPPPAPPPAPAAATALPLPLKPDSVGAQVLVDASQKITALTDEVVSMARAVTDFPLLWNWVTQLITDATLQLAILDTVWRLAVVLAAGLSLEALVARLLRRPRRRLADRAPPEHAGLDEAVEGIAEAEAGQTEWLRRRASAMVLLRRVPYVFGAFLLDLLPLVGLVSGAALLLAFGLAGRITARLVIIAVLNAYLVWRLATAVARAAASPGLGRLRLLPIDDDQASVVVADISRLVAIAIAGYTMAEVALLFGLYRVAHDALLKLVALIVYGQVVVIVLRNRRGVRDLLRAADGSGGPVALLRGILASTWHRVVIFYLLALWTVWALDIPNGFERLLRVVLVAMGAAIAAQLLSVAVQGTLRRALRGSERLAERYPGLDTRLASYHPIAAGFANLTIGAVATVVVLQAWGLNAFDWFAGGALGGQVLQATITIIVTLVASLVTWELVNLAIERHLTRLAREAQLARSARLRTLLPMLRTTLLATVCLVAGLVVLSEIGVNIGPLLAGAGVIGLAIGFGSQKLVQDIITGLFLLLENTMQVGDVVSLGGLSGTVENLSIRTIRLRALDGSVHIVPFSAVTTVTNMTRDFGYAVVDVVVGVNEEPDRIGDILREIAAAMRLEQAWRSVIMADLEVMGVEKFQLTTWVLRVRIKTLPSSRWAVGRELNRRIKYRFDALAIESPMTSYRALGLVAPAPTLETDPVEGVTP